jgi:hypothetical protein
VRSQAGAWERVERGEGRRGTVVELITKYLFFGTGHGLGDDRHVDDILRAAAAR